MTAPTNPEQRNAVADRPQEQAPILCECRAYQQGRLGPHRDHLATYRRLQLAGRVPDEQAFALVGQP